MGEQPFVACNRDKETGHRKMRNGHQPLGSGEWRWLITCDAENEKLGKHDGSNCAYKGNNRESARPPEQR